ncbi:oligosaccharide flippase family protein [Bacteroidota bacterium]
MKKKFLSNLILLVFLNLLIKPFWFFGIEVAVQNRVGEEMYGFYFSLFNFAFIMNILLDIGITNYNNRNIARDQSRLGPSLTNIIPLKFILSIFYALLVFLAGLVIGYDNIQFKLLLFLVINQFLASFILYLRSNISGIQLFRTDSLLSVLDRTLMIILTGLLLWTNIARQAFQIEWFVYTQTVSYCLTSLIIFIIVRYHAGRIRIRFNLIEMRSILKLSYPFALLILLMSFFNRADSVMLERLLPDGKFQAGLYAQSYRVLDAFSQFSLLFAGLLLPMFSKMLKTKEKIGELLQIAVSLLLTVSISVAVIGYFFNNDIISLLYSEENGASPKIFRLLMIGYIGISVSYIYGTLLTANRNLKQLNLLALVTVVINITLNLILIPSHKALGAAIASLCSQGFYAISQVIISHRLFHLDLKRSLIPRVLVYASVVILIAFGSMQLLNWLPAMIIVALGSIAAAILTGLLRPKELWGILAEK